MRLHLALALITTFLLVITLRSNERHHFDFVRIQALAEQRAKQKYVPLPNALPPQLKNLTPDQENGIFWNDAYRLWRKKGLPFQIDFYHVSKTFPTSPIIHTVDGKGPHLLAYAPSFFHFSNLQINPPLPPNLGYAGFYLRYPINKPDSLDGFFSVEGADYFRVLAKDQVYGLQARGITLNTAIEGKKEEFPDFCEWWLQEPAPDASQITLDALLDGPSVTGAYEFKIRPGGVTSVDVHASLFFRQAVERLGLAPLTSMYLFGENAKNHLGDNFHPEIHDSDGVLINQSNGEWIWRPLEQAPLIQLYNFPDENPKGFGLLQRDRDFQHYQDSYAKYNIRPSAWIVPHGNWGKGSIQLIQLPTNNTNTDNVVLFWHPDQAIKAGDHLDFDYTIDFYMNDADRPPLAYCKQTLVNSPAPPPLGIPVAAVKDTVPVQFMIDFIGDGIENIPPNKPPHLDLTCNPPVPETYIREWKVEKDDFDHLWRASFTIIPSKHNVPTEILCHLMRDKEPLTETWTYTLHQ